MAHESVHQPVGDTCLSTTDSQSNNEGRNESSDERSGARNDGRRGQGEKERRGEKEKEETDKTGKCQVSDFHDTSGHGEKETYFPIGFFRGKESDSPGPRHGINQNSPDTISAN